MSNSKRDANYAFNERTFDGAAAMWLRKSAEEAPEVGTYDYDKVDFQAYDGGATDLNEFTSQWTTTLYGDQLTSKGQKSDIATVDIDTLLNDVWFCVMIEDSQKMVSLLERARIAGFQYPADYQIKNMFGVSTLWSRIHDPDFKISGGSRDSAVRIFSSYHKD
jgi:hypothetical protein